jgi:hypothetical protein
MKAKDTQRATTVGMEQMELYYAAHPGSPSAVRRPRLSIRGDLWIALLGPSAEEGILGIGATVEAALRAFDAQYLAALRPPIRTVRSHTHRTSTISPS